MLQLHHDALFGDFEPPEAGPLSTTCGPFDPDEADPDEHEEPERREDEPDPDRTPIRIIPGHTTEPDFR